MDLRKVTKFTDEISFIVTEEDVARLHETGILFQERLKLFNFEFISFYPNERPTFSLLSANMYEEMDRYFGSYEISLSNGLSYKDSFWSWSKISFLTCDELTEWISPRKVTIKCDIGYYYGPVDENCDWQQCLTEIADFETVCIPATPHSSRMEKMFQEGKDSDFLLVSSNGSEIKVHRNILTVSPYFNAYFIYAANDNNVLEIDAEEKTLKSFVAFLYTGRIKEEEVNWKDLFKLASYFLVPDLARTCELQLMGKVRRSMDGIKDEIKFAIKFCALKLKRYIVSLCRIIQEESLL